MIFVSIALSILCTGPLPPGMNDCTGLPCLWDGASPYNWGTDAIYCPYLLRAPRAGFYPCAFAFVDSSGGFPRETRVLAEQCLGDGLPLPHDYQNDPKWWCHVPWLPGCGVLHRAAPTN